MAEFLQEPDIQELAGNFLSGYDRDIARIPQDLYAPFLGQAKMLESNLLLMYQATVICVRREEDLEKVANRWGGMVNLCGRCLDRLKSLHEGHPNCGADVYYNSVLELRSKCQRLQNLHSN